MLKSKNSADERAIDAGKVEESRGSGPWLLIVKRKSQLLVAVARPVADARQRHSAVNRYTRPSPSARSSRIRVKGMRLPSRRRSSAIRAAVCE